MDKDSLLYTLVADKQLDIELDKRVVHRFAATVLEPKGLAELGAPLFKEGSIVLFIASTDRAKVVAKFLKSLAAADLKAIDEMDTLMRAAQSAGLHQVRGSSVFEAPHLVDVSYGTERLVRGVAPSMVGGIAVAVAVWNGGELDHAKFTVADYVKDAKTKSVSVHAVLTRPRLTKLEQAVLKTLPADIDDLRLEGPSVAWAAVAREGAHVPADHHGPVVGQEAQGPVLGQEVQQQQDAWTNNVERIQQQQENTQVQQEQVQVQQADHQYQDQHQNQQDNNQHVQQQQLQEQYFTNGMAQIQQQQDAQTKQQQQQKVQTRQGRQEQQHQGSSESWLDDRQGASLNPFDRDAYLNAIAETDFAALDVTQSAHALLRIRSEFVRRGMG